LGCGSQVPGQEFTDAVDRMLSDPSQDGAKIERGIKAVQFGRADEGVERSCAHPTGIGTEEQIVLASDGSMLLQR